MIDYDDAVVRGAEVARSGSYSSNLGGQSAISCFKGEGCLLLKMN